MRQLNLRTGLYGIETKRKPTETLKTREFPSISAQEVFIVFKGNATFRGLKLAFDHGVIAEFGRDSDDSLKTLVSGFYFCIASILLPKFPSDF